MALQQNHSSNYKQALSYLNYDEMASSSICIYVDSRHRNSASPFWDLSISLKLLSL